MKTLTHPQIFHRVLVNVQVIGAGLLNTLFLITNCEIVNLLSVAKDCYVERRYD